MATKIDIDTALPGFKPTSETIYIGQNESSVAFSSNALLHPFTAESRIVCNRSPVICLCCGCYLNKYCSIDKSSGSWLCPLCNTSNMAFDSVEISKTLPSGDNELTGLTSKFLELQVKSIDFIEMTDSPPCTGVSKFFTFILMIDCKLCTDNALSALLENGLSTLPSECNVCIVLFSSVLSVLRLSPSTNPLTADVLPGNTDCSTVLSHLMQRGQYTAPVYRIIECWALISRTLVCLSTSAVKGTEAAQKYAASSEAPPTATIHAIIGFALSLSNQRKQSLHQSDGGMAWASRLILFTSGNFSLGHSRSIRKPCNQPRDGGSVNHRNRDNQASPCQPYADLAADALSIGCWIDVISISIHAVDVAALDALVQTSGGRVLHGHSLESDSLRESFITVLQQPRDVFPPHAELAVVEFRTSENMTVTDVVGAVVEDEFLTERTRINIPYVNQVHLANTVQAAIRSHAWASISVDSVQTYHRDMETKCKEQVVRAVLGRCDPLTAMTVVYRGTPPSGRSRRPGQEPSKNDFAYIQCVVKFSWVDSVGAVLHTTRVWTSRLQFVRDLDLHLQAMDELAWTVAAARLIVADAHQALADLDHESRDVSDRDMSSSYIRSQAVSAVDHLAKEVAVRWTDARQAVTASNIRKARVVARLLYHLREGPLLIGPAVDSQHSYVLRASFLCCPVHLAKLLLQPSLELCVFPSLVDPSSRTESDGSAVTTDGVAEDGHILPTDDAAASNRRLLLSVPPDWMWLCVGTLALLDLGDLLLVWFDESVADDEIEWVIREAEGRAFSRHPCVEVQAVQIGGAQDRLLLARTAPATCDPDFENYDTDDSGALGVPLDAVAMIAGDVSDAALRSLWSKKRELLPHTDQPSFRRYLLQLMPFLIPDFRDKTKKVVPVAPLPPMDRGDADIGTDGGNGAPPYSIAPSVADVPRWAPVELVYDPQHESEMLRNVAEP